MFHSRILGRISFVFSFSIGLNISVSNLCIIGCFSDSLICFMDVLLVVLVWDI